MTVLPFAVAAALVLVAGAATAYSAVDRSRSAAAVVAAAVLATTEAPRGPSLVGAFAIRPDVAAAVALAALATVMVFGQRRPVAGVVLGAAMVLLGPLLLRDPFLDPGCRAQCPPNPWALVHSPVAATWVLRAGVVLATLSLVLLVLTNRGNVLATAAGVAVGAVCVGADRAPLLAASLLGAVGLVVLASDVGRAARQRDRLRAVVEELARAEHPETALHDRAGIRLEYHLPDEDVWVDAHGNRAGSPGPGRGLQPSVRVLGPQGVIARVVDPGSPTAVERWARQLRGPARLALDNGRRAARCAFEAQELVESSRRLVARADDERRRVERDLHDGAQQHVLALGVRLTLYQEDLGRDDPTWTAVDRSRARVMQVLDDLRDIAHGIHITALDGAGGLAHAIDLLANRSLVPVDQHVLVEPPDRASAVTAYALVEEAVAASTGPVVVETADGDGFLVRVAGEGVPAPVDVLTRSHDRFRALGGSLVVGARGDAGFVVQGWLPGTHSLSRAGTAP